MRLTSRSAVVAVLAAGGALLTAMPALAEGGTSRVHDEQSRLAARAYGLTGVPSLCARDELKDGHSGVLAYWPKGSPELQLKVWAYGGQYDVACSSVGVQEGVTYVIRACYGEYAERRTIRCGATAEVRYAT